VTAGAVLVLVGMLGAAAAVRRSASRRN
jgi:hypothetical protein